jgi:hypothetical protein
MERFERYNKKPRVFTGGAVLPNGSIAELVRDPQNGLCQLLVYAPLEGTARTLSHLNFEDKYYQAIDEPKDWIRKPPIRNPMVFHQCRIPEFLQYVVL